MEPPHKPDESDCCNSGCNPCILDVYEDLMKKYKKRRESSNIQYTNCILPTSYSVFKLVKLESHAEDAFLYTFQFIKLQKASREPTDNLRLHYNPGQYFLLKAGYINDEFTRAYTPIHCESKKLEFTILVKLYEYGRMSKFLKRLKIGGEMLWRGPHGDYNNLHNNKHILFVAQGTGIAPIYSIIKTLLDNDECLSFIKLMFCSKNYSSIYLHDQLYELQSHWNFTYEVFLCSSNDAIQKYNETIHNQKLNEDMLKLYLADKNDIHVAIAGSENFMHIIKRYVVDIGIDEKNIFLF